MAESATATVEVLTAEVRVLMVGSRQVTASVARQLDWVDRDKLTPFGRVRLGTRLIRNGREHPEGVLIGSDTDGLLSLSSMREQPGHPFVDEDDLSDKIIVCRRVSDRYPRQRFIPLNYAEQRIVVHLDAITWCEGHDAGEPGCDHWQTNGQKDRLDAVMERWVSKIAAAVFDEQLPLIVLAGLR